MGTEAMNLAAGVTVATEDYKVFAATAATRQTPVFYAPTLTQDALSTPELRESHERGMADLKAGRFKIFDSVEELLRDLDD